MQQAAHDLQWTIGNALAVPSDGSNLMQQQLAGDEAQQEMQLAVPSDGSNLMQLLLPPIATSTTPSCSTLRRVEPNATTYTYAQPFVQRSCSTLRRVEPNATPSNHGNTTTLSALAVPSDGSNLMQPTVAMARTTTVATCSTLR